MKLKRLTALALALPALLVGALQAHQEHGTDHTGHSAEHVQPAEEEAFAGDPYSLGTCPVSGEELGSMGAPVRFDLGGREVLLCCKGCVKSAKADPKKVAAAVDKAMILDQRPHYPLETCVVSGKPLVEDGQDVAVEGIVKNRLFRVCCEGCLEKVEAQPAKYFEQLDAAVKRAQGPDYPLETCLGNPKSRLGSMGDPYEIVVANRLVRFCCSGCEPAFDKDVAGHLARLDATWAKAREEAPGKPAGEAAGGQ